MKKMYRKPEVDKIAFNYRDQVVAASTTDSDSVTVENSAGYGSPICGEGGIVDWALDLLGSATCVA